MSIASIAWSLTSIFTFFCSEFWQVGLLRVILGVFEAFSGPIAYSLIVDFFPQEKRTVANSFFSLGIYVGVGLSSITVIVDGMAGWRETYLMVGIFGVFVGFSTLLFIVEPTRGLFEVKPQPVAAPTPS